MIPLRDCKHGFLYKLESRNLDFGVFNSVNSGFIGIRYKLGDKFLFTENHWEIGPPFGTAKPIEELQQVPKDLLLVEIIGSKDNKTGREITYCSVKRGWYNVDTGEICDDADPMAVTNKQLFDYLVKVL